MTLTQARKARGAASCFPQAEAIARGPFQSANHRHRCEIRMSLKIVSFLAIILTALALVPSGAHLLEMPNKVSLAPDAYFIAQQLYAGWWLTGLLHMAALVAVATLAALLRHDRYRFALAVFAAAMLVAFFAIFFTWTFPANQATANWTRIPDDWEQLRRAWEVSHAVNAVVLFLALCAVVAAAVDLRSGRVRALPSGDATHAHPG